MVETEVDWEVCYPLGNCVYLVADYVIRWTEGTLQVMKPSRRFCISFIIIYLKNVMFIRCLMEFLSNCLLKFCCIVLCYVKIS